MLLLCMQMYTMLLLCMQMYTMLLLCIQMYTMLLHVCGLLILIALPHSSIWSTCLLPCDCAELRCYQSWMESALVQCQKRDNQGLQGVCPAFNWRERTGVQYFWEWDQWIDYWESDCIYQLYSQRIGLHCWWWTKKHSFDCYNKWREHMWVLVSDSIATVQVQRVLLSSNSVELYYSYITTYFILERRCNHGDEITVNTC